MYCIESRNRTNLEGTGEGTSGRMVRVHVGTIQDQARNGIYYKKKHVRKQTKETGHAV